MFQTVASPVFVLKLKKKNKKNPKTFNWNLDTLLSGAMGPQISSFVHISLYLVKMRLLGIYLMLSTG